MPYNLRKRKEPAVEEVKPEPVKKKAKPRANKVSKPSEETEPAIVEEVKPEPIKKKAKSRSAKESKPEEEVEQEILEEVVSEPVKKKAKSRSAKESEPEEESKQVHDEEVAPEPAKKKARAKAIKESKPTEETEPSSVEEVKSEPVKKKSKPQAIEEPKADEEIKPASVRNQFVFGIDSCGELGQGKIGIKKRAPTLVPINEPIKQVACGPMHTLSLTESGQVYSYGCNDEGALGRQTNEEEEEATPQLVPIEGKVIKVSAGDSHSAALTEDNKVFIWGNFRDEHGSVGLTPSSDGQAVSSPTQVLSEKKLKDIASGSNHMLLLDIDGVVYSFGVGAQGQLGRLNSDQVGSEKEGDSNAISTSNRELFLKPQPVSLKDVDPQRPFICDAIYAGNMSSFATNTDKKKNRLAGWGLNNYFQLGYKGQKGQLIQYYPKRSTFTCSTSMIDVACGQHHSLFLTKTGRVYSAGRHEYGMLGLGKQTKEVCPAKQIEELGTSIKQISAGINTSFAVSAEGKLYTWGMSGVNLGIDEDDKDLNVPTEMKALDGKKVVQVGAGSSFTAVLVDYT